MVFTDSLDEKGKLFAALEDVSGWLDPGEAWALREAARGACSRTSSPIVVEIGSFHGRSTISLAYGLQAGGRGCVYAIDPHRRPGNFERFASNIERAGVDHIVNQMRAFSAKAVDTFAPASVDVLFIDGAHDYGSVYQDIKNWAPKLTAGAVVILNDVVWWKGVQRAILDTIARGRCGFRNPRWVCNTLFLDHRPSERWTIADSMRHARLRFFLRVAGRWTGFHKEMESRPRSWDVAKRLDVRLMMRSLKALLPAA